MLIAKDLAKRTNSDKVLRDRASEIALSSEYDGYIYIYILRKWWVWCNIIIECKWSATSRITQTNHKKFERRRLCAMFKYLSCVIDVLTNMLGLNLRQIKMLKHFLLVGIINEHKPTPNTLWVDQGKHFSNILMLK